MIFSPIFARLPHRSSRQRSPAVAMRRFQNLPPQAHHITFRHRQIIYLCTCGILCGCPCCGDFHSLVAALLTPRMPSPKTNRRSRSRRTGVDEYASFPRHCTIAAAPPVSSIHDCADDNTPPWTDACGQPRRGACFRTKLTLLGEWPYNAPVDSPETSFSRNHCSVPTRNRQPPCAFRRSFSTSCVPGFRYRK
jgi:hypothetical protein